MSFSFAARRKMSGTALFTGLFLTVIAMVFGLHLVGNSDLFWQLTTGRLIWQTQAIPHVDPFSWSIIGAPWINLEWLSGVLFAAVHHIGGFVGLSWFSWVICGGLAAALFLGLYRAGASRGMALLLTLLVFLFSASRFQQLRPELFGFLLFTLMLSVLVTELSAPSWKLWLLIPLEILWANMHGSALIGPLMVAIFCGLSWKRSVVFFLCLGALLLNPYGMEAVTFPLLHLLQHFTLSVVSDWNPPQFFSGGADVAAWGTLLFGFGCLGAFFRFRRIPPLPLVLLSFLGLLAGLYAARFTPFAVITLSFLFVALVAAPLKAGVSVGSQRTHGMATIVSCLLLFLCIMIGPLYGAEWGGGKISFLLGRSIGIGLDRDNFPIEAVDKLEEMGIRERVFNDMAYGGYLIYRRWPIHRVFIDTRTPVYGEAFLKEYVEALFHEEKFESLVQRFAITAVLYDRRQIMGEQSPLRFLWNNRRWVPVFQSANAVLFVHVAGS